MAESTGDWALLRSVLSLVARADAHDCLWWSADSGDNVRLFVNCSGLFIVASDVEPITADRLEAFRQAFADTAKVTGGDMTAAAVLYVCRMRGVRPRQSAYPSDSRLWPLLDAVGPDAADLPPDGHDFGVIVP